MSSMTKSRTFRRLGFRLTAWYASILCLTVVLIGGFLYYRLQHNLYKQHDKFLELLSEDFAMEVHENLGNLGLIKEELDREISFGKHPNIVYRLFTPDGAVVARTEFFPNGDRPANELVRAASGSENTLPPWTVHGDSGYPYRATAEAVWDAGKLAYVVETGYSARPIYKTMENYRKNFARVLLPLLVLGVTGGWWLARKSLAPIADITNAAQAISRESLGQRIPVKGAEDELDRLAEVLNEMLDRLRESFERVDRFSSDLAHELRTPLTSLKGEAERALTEPCTADELRGIIASQAEVYDHLNTMITDLLLLSRGGNAPTSSLGALDVAACVGEAVDAFMVLAEDAGVQLAFSRPDRPCMAKGDRSALRRLFSNLLDNSIKHTGAGGTISVTVQAGGPRHAVTVDDTGEGIPAEDLPHVFERFYRGDRSRSRDTGGFGLGLSICRQIADDHGGEIAIESQAGRGTKVTITLPADSS